MNQPKFSIGDKVKCKKFNDVWVIHWINLGFQGYECMSEIKDGSYKSTNEKYLELYQEPKKKKLYAYRQEDKWPIIFDIEEHGLMERLPEYDIEYPSEEVK